jgi:GNAT superfamily N-acetyltransferase
VAIRKKQEGKLVIEQTRDLAIVRAMLSGAGRSIDGLEWPAACYLAAYFGSEPVGVIGVEPSLDAALLRSLYVADAMRGRGIGGELVASARKAAHTRGARSLYILSADAGEYFQRFGFVEVPVAQLVAALGGTPMVKYYRTRPDDLAREVAWFLDISQDGVILR